MSSGKRGANWTVHEDEALCAAWLATSQDASIGINQRASTLYERVFGEFVVRCQEKGLVGNPELRASSGIKARWLHINKVVGKFAGCVAQIQKRNQSGATPEDALKQAVTLFAETEKTNFTLMHCFVILQNAPKWQQYQAPSFKREADFVDLSCDNQQSTASTSRPAGQKAAKARKILAVDNASLQMAKAGSILAAAAKKKIVHSKQKAQALTRIANHAIMSVNLESLSETSREYYVLEQKRILEETKSLIAYETEEPTPDDDSWVQCS